MKIFLLIILSLAIFSCKKGSESKNNSDQQTTKSEAMLKTPDDIQSSMGNYLTGKLSRKERTTLFTRRRKKELDINYKILDAYKYEDTEGEHYLAVSKQILSITKKKDTLYDKIKLIDLRYKDKQFKKRFITKDDIDEEWETSIWLWTAYSEIADLDGDGLTDLILVYGTIGQDMYVDGKVNILIYSKKKTTIKHQNSDLYDGRNTKIKSSFYVLPTKIQNAVKEKMRLMAKNGHARFPANWEKEMEKEAYDIIE